jgi:hypothetical protein
MATKPTNAEIADMLERIAEILEAEDENPFRVRAYRDGAQSIQEADQSVAELVRQDEFDKLKALPHIGEGIAAVVGEYVTTGRSALLDQLEANASPAAIFTSVPGIGKELAHRIADQLGIKTLPELEEAAHNGQLATVEGFGARRVKAVQTALAGMLSQSARRGQANRQQTDQADGTKNEAHPSVELLLKVDEEYRRGAEAGKLHKIAPKRFNPKGEAWLPVLNKKEGGWSFTALYSNTAQAHKLGKTDDWVVIYYERGGKEGQNTVVTETQGALKGKRVVRGRNLENKRYYGTGASPRARTSHAHAAR